MCEGRNGKTATMQNEDQPKRGRPSAYSEKIAEAICDRLVDRESLRAICADPGMPSKATVFRWLASNKEFRQSDDVGNVSHNWVGLAAPKSG